MINCENRKSNNPKIIAISAITNITSLVIFQASSEVGQVTLRSSPMVSRQNRWIFWKNVSFFFFLGDTEHSLSTSKTPPLLDGVEKFQAGQAGIEPATPAFGERCSAKLSYWPVHIVKSAKNPSDSSSSTTSFYLTMRGMLPASRTVLFQLQPAWIITTVFLSRIITLLAIRAFQCYDRADTFLFCHVNFIMVASKMRQPCLPSLSMLTQ